MGFSIYTENTPKWRLQELDQIVDLFDEEIADRINNSGLIRASDYLNVVAFTAGKAIVTMREVIALSILGFADGALSLARNIYEQAITLAFFEEHRGQADFQKYVDDYCTNYEIQVNKTLKWYCKSNERLQDKAAEFEKKIGDIEKKAGKSTRGDYWWSGCPNFQELSKAVIKNYNDFEKPLLYKAHLMYKRACMSLHAGFFGNSNRLGKDSGFLGIDTSPSLNGLSTPLWFSTMAFTYIVGIACILFGIDFSKYRTSLNELLLFYQEMESNELTIKE